MNDIFEYLVIYILNFCRFFLIFHMITFDLLIEINFQYIFFIKKKKYKFWDYHYMHITQTLKILMKKLVKTIFIQPKIELKKKKITFHIILKKKYVQIRIVLTRK